MIAGERASMADRAPLSLANQLLIFLVVWTKGLAHYLTSTKQELP